MITVVQRVSRAQVRVGDAVAGSIGAGLLLLVGVQKGDVEADGRETARKVAALRVFPGRTPMDRTVLEAGGGCLVVSQFTLAGSIRRGNRPSFDGAEAPEAAEALYGRVATSLAELGVPVATGRFGAAMEVEMVGDGPVTFLVACRAGRLVDVGPLVPPAPA